MADYRRYHRDAAYRSRVLAVSLAWKRADRLRRAARLLLFAGTVRRARVGEGEGR